MGALRRNCTRPQVISDKWQRTLGELWWKRGPKFLCKSMDPLGIDLGILTFGLVYTNFLLILIMFWLRVVCFLVTEDHIFLILSAWSTLPESICNKNYILFYLF